MRVSIVTNYVLLSFVYLFRWLTYNDRDPYGELEWLVRVLYDAEKKGERVHIIGHVDLGQLTAYDICTRELNRILRRSFF